jgi:hypothetical protein
LPGVTPSRGLRWPANPVAARPDQHNRSERRKRGQRRIYTPFISRAPAALLIAADCVVAGDATLGESGPFFVPRDEATRAADVEPRTTPKGTGFWQLGAVRPKRTASACRGSPAPLKRSRSRDLWAAKGRYWIPGKIALRAVFGARKTKAAASADRRKRGRNAPVPICLAFRCRRRQAPSRACPLEVGELVEWRSGGFCIAPRRACAPEGACLLNPFARARTRTRLHVRARVRGLKND